MKHIISILSALLLLVAGVQTAAAQGFRVYQSDGTELQFSMKTDSIVFDNGLSGDEVFGPFTPVNICIAGTWYQSKTQTVTFSADGTTDYVGGATYKFFPYQGNLVIYNEVGAPLTFFRVLDVTSEKLLVSQLGSNVISQWGSTPMPTLVEEIQLSSTSLFMEPDETKTLTAIVLPLDADNPEVTWSSSDENVAEVNKKGRVVSNGEGTCTITCSATDGSGVYAECQVTVGSQNYILVSNIVLSKTSLNLQPGDKSELVAYVYPANAYSDEVDWWSSDESVAEVDEQSGHIYVSAVGSGTCTIFCAATDGSGVTATCQVTVTENDGHLCPDDHHPHTIDLGLPSGTKWACCNVGASKPEDYGDYFAWGETKPMTDEWDTWDTYFDTDDGGNTFKKYNNNGGKTELDPEDDAATANWYDPWHIPTESQLQELFDNCFIRESKQNGVYGRLVTGPNGGQIFLPAAGQYENAVLYREGSNGDYWSSSLSSYGGDDHRAYSLDFHSNGTYLGSSNRRDYGLSVRAVRK